MLSDCDHCGGFLPPGADDCPHCDASGATATSLGRRLSKLGAAVILGAASMTLMACYGAPDDNGPGGDSSDGGNHGGEGGTGGSYDCDSPGVSCEETYCNDDYDDDHDGLTDCLDPDCAVACTHEQSCTDGTDDDGDGLTDCADLDDCECTGEVSCDNGYDDDHDGLTDCADDWCDTSCWYELSCTNGYDDDHDGLTDCADRSCDSECVFELGCNNDYDDDGDGLLDCADDDCDAECIIELGCGNGYDDDGDGLLDCADDDCEATCADCGDGSLAADEECDDGALIDGDGCNSSCSIEPTAFCAALPELAPGANQGSTNASAVFTGSCIDEQGASAERAYRFVTPSEGTLYLTLDPDVDLGMYVLLGCGPQASEIACANSALGAGLETTELPLPAGVLLTVVVDGSAPETIGGYVVLANFVPSGG